MPELKASTAVVATAVLRPVLLVRSAAAQNPVANSVEMQAVRPNQPIQNFRPNFPLWRTSSRISSSVTLFR